MKTPMQDTVRLVMETEPGKEFVSHILGICGIFDFIVGDNVERELGRREVGLEVIDLLMEVDPEIYPQLLLRQAKLERSEEINNDN